MTDLSYSLDISKIASIAKAFFTRAMVLNKVEIG